MPTVLLRKHLGAFRPGDAEAQALFDKLKDGQTVRAEIKRMRSPQQHRMYWGLCKLIFDNQSRYSTVRDVSDALLCAVGHCYEDEIRLGDKVMWRQRAKSISFGNMDQDQFNDLFNRVLDVVVEKLLPMAKEGLRREVEAMI